MMAVDETIDRITQILYDENADEWSVQDKGNLLAAVKLSLQKKADE